MMISVIISNSMLTRGPTVWSSVTSVDVVGPLIPSVAGDAVCA